MAKNEITYTQAVEEIEQILAKFNTSQMNVDDLGISVKRAAELIKLCKEKLRKAEDEVAKALGEE